MRQDNEGQGRAGGETSRRLYVYNGGFLKEKRLRRILSLAGWRVSLGLPGPQDAVGVWGMSPYAARGEAVAARRGAPLVRIEDAFLRSRHPGRAGEPPLGLLIDRKGVHFDPSTPSDLETLLATHPLDNHALLQRAKGAMARMREENLSKYCAYDPDLLPPDPGYVLIVDQTQGDASVRASKADRNRFLEMLYWAQEEHPTARILIRSHPETAAGHRPGHYRPEDAQGRVEFTDAALSPWALLDGAIAVYTVSSQMGFEAILAGHKPRVFGQPFYAGWGLTAEETPLPRRARALTRAQLFAAAMVLYPTWYDPFRDRLCELEDVLATLEARTRAWREDRHGWTARGMRPWKRRHIQKMFGSEKPVLFESKHSAPNPDERRRMAWGQTAEPGETCVEDGFLRSRGLGAELVPPLSLVADDLGIYYDPTRPSRLERLIAASASLRPAQSDRARALIRQLATSGLTKYNLPGSCPVLPEGHRILVPGQVEDDASILKGSPAIQGNADLLARVRADNPDAMILYKPHPDVQAGLRAGTVEQPEQWADIILGKVDMGALLPHVQEVWTLTSLTGFEALIRGIPVTTLGAPFYAGWGLTRDLGPVPARRLSGPRPTLEGLVHATLIAYARYHDPVTNTPCPVEVIADRLVSGSIPPSSPSNRIRSKLQGLFAHQAHYWRR